MFLKMSKKYLNGDIDRGLTTHNIHKHLIPQLCLYCSPVCVCSLGWNQATGNIIHSRSEGGEGLRSQGQSLRSLCVTHTYTHKHTHCPPWGQQDKLVWGRHVPFTSCQWQHGLVAATHHWIQITVSRSLFVCISLLDIFPLYQSLTQLCILMFLKASSYKMKL